MLNYRGFGALGVLSLLCFAGDSVIARAEVSNPKGLQDLVLKDDFDQGSCLRRAKLGGWMTDQGELVLAIQGGASGLQTLTRLSYGRYTARIKTDIGSGAVVAFYLMGVNTDQRNIPAMSHLHDEIDIELVGSLWREYQHVGTNATWFNAFHKHTALVLPLHPRDDAGGSLLTLATRVTTSDALFNRHVVTDLDQNHGFIGHNFNDAKFYTYTIDYGEAEIRYAVSTDDGRIVKSHTLRRTGDAWPTTAMYLALSLWSSNDPALQGTFTGRYDKRFGRPMTATFDYVSYQPQAGVTLPESWRGRMPWLQCPM